MSGEQAAKVERAAATKARSKWYVIDTVHVPHHCAEEFDMPAGAVLWVNAVYAADDPLFAFHDPSNYPRLGKKVVEAANRRHRKAHRVYERTMIEFDLAYWDALERGETTAGKRMSIHALKPWETGGVLVAGAGGWIVDGLPPLSGDANVDWLGEMVCELMAARARDDFGLSDAIKREIVLGAGAYLFMAKDGVEFVDAKDWTQ